MQLKKGEIIELEISDIAFGGSGIGRYDGKVVFVNSVMRGDKVKASLKRIKKDFMEADLVEIVSKSPERIEPRCPYFERCGGCSFQFMPYEKQLELKKQHVIDSFERIGKLKNPPVKEVIGCENQYFYRNKMEFSFGYDGEMNFALGMHVPGRKFDILDLEECYLQSELSVKIVNLMRDFAVKKKWKPFKFSVGEGFLRQLFVREGKNSGEVLVNLVTSNDLPENFEKDKMELVHELLELNQNEGGSEPDKRITSIYWSEIISKRGVRRQTREHLLFGKRTLNEKLNLKNGDSLEFDILPQAFFQVNTAQAEILYNRVLELVKRGEHNVVFDLFCGTGTIGLFIAKHVEQVWGVELNEDAVVVARENARKNNIFNIDFFTGDVGKVLERMKDRPSLIVVDPPRAGLTPKMIDQLNGFGAGEIIYVSCNPATLARDCQLLGEYGYKVQEITPVDMFPHTYHIENVCLLSR